MHTLLITLTTTQNSIDLQMPAEVPIEKLMPKVLDLCGPKPQNAEQGNPSQWHLRLSDAAIALDMTQSFYKAGVTDGAVVVLEDRTPVAPQRQQKREEQEQAFLPRNISPGPETGGIGVRWNTKEQ